MKVSYIQTVRCYKESCRLLREYTPDVNYWSRPCISVRDVRFLGPFVRAAHVRRTFTGQKKPTYVKYPYCCM